jgi:hypothetical protein
VDLGEHKMTNQNIETIPIGQTETHHDVLNRLRVAGWTYIPRTVEDKVGSNTGKLFYAWIVFRLRGAESWYKAVVWETELEDRHLIVDWRFPIEASSAAVAAQVVMEETNTMGMEVSQNFVDVQPGPTYHLQFLEEEKERKRELQRDRLRWN